jgi:hypothetical protein
VSVRTTILTDAGETPDFLAGSIENTCVHKTLDRKEIEILLNGKSVKVPALLMVENPLCKVLSSNQG